MYRLLLSYHFVACPCFTSQQRSRVQMCIQSFSFSKVTGSAGSPVQVEWSLVGSLLGRHLNVRLSVWF